MKLPIARVFGPVIILGLASAAAFLLFYREEPVLTSLALDDIALEGANDFGHFDPLWDLSVCDLQLHFTYDATGLVDDKDSQAWTLFGARQADTFDFNPLDGAGVWLVADYEWFTDTFEPDPAGQPVYDIDDRLILQNTLGGSEEAYDLPASPPDPWDNHAVWFDRDGVGEDQTELWGMLDGVTYNTGGLYEVLLEIRRTGSSRAEAYLTVNGASQGFYDPAWHPGPADLMPAGLSLSGDLSRMQVFYFLTGFGVHQSVEFRDIEVTGCLASE